MAGVLQQQKCWWIRSVDDVRTAEVLFQHRQPQEEMNLRLPAATPAPALLKLAKAIRKENYEKRLDIHLYRSKVQHFTCCDEMVKQFQGAK